MEHRKFALDMKEVLIVIFAFVYIQSINAQVNAPEFLWTRQISCNDADRSYAICSDSAGNVYVVGETGEVEGVADTTVSPDTTFFDVNMLVRDSAALFIASYDKHGRFRWARCINDAAYWGHTGEIAYDGRGNIYIASDNYLNVNMPDTSFAVGSAFTMLMKFDTSGSFKWVRSADGVRTSAAHSSAIKVDHEGNVIWGGEFNDSISFGSVTVKGAENTGQGFIVKFDPTGNLVWSKIIRAEPYCHISDIAIVGQETFYAAGSFRDTISYGDSFLISTGKYDIFVAKFTLDGAFQGVVTYGGKGDDFVSSISADANGFYLSGSFDDSITFRDGITLHASYSYFNSVLGSNYIAAADTNGAVRWARHFANADSLPTWSCMNARMVLSPSGVLIISSSLEGATRLTEKVTLLPEREYSRTLIALTKDGEYAWSKHITGQMGGVMSTRTTDIAVYADSTIYFATVLGSKTGITFGDTVLVTELPPASNWDIFISKLGYPAPLAVEQAQPIFDHQVGIFPNPAQGQEIVVKVPERFLDKELSITFINMLGSQMFAYSMYVEGDTVALPVAGLSHGSYILRLEADGVTAGSSIVKIVR